MPLKLWISREEEAEIHDFKIYEEAKKNFKEKYENPFQLSEPFKIDGEQIYSYMYIIDREKFKEMQDYIEKYNTYLINDGDLDTNRIIPINSDFRRL
ncbi:MULTISPECIES: hypothetical protein [Bacillus]|uniref:hypothetical protein n=1 Tax=Bacillus TaxID=1386 RepID=UPI001FDA42B0|nr:MULTISPECIES: hypothetical protein [Bacillus cereus group]MDA2275435.1 hypothetical protein [Bacillus cereus]WBO70017.1 hypothetical protein GVV68_02835 [Bacillus cereus]